MIPVCYTDFYYVKKRSNKEPWWVCIYMSQTKYDGLNVAPYGLAVFKMSHKKPLDKNYNK